MVIIMKTIEEFLDEFTKTHCIQSVNKINGVIIASIGEDYIVNTEEVGEIE